MRLNGTQKKGGLLPVVMEKFSLMEGKQAVGPDKPKHAFICSWRTSVVSHKCLGFHVQSVKNGILIGQGHESIKGQAGWLCSLVKSYSRNTGDRIHAVIRNKGWLTSGSLLQQRVKPRLRQSCPAHRSERQPPMEILRAPMLVRLSHHNKLPQTGYLKQQKVNARSSAGSSSRTGCQCGQVQVRALFLAWRCHLMECSLGFSLVHAHGKRERHLFLH